MELSNHGSKRLQVYRGMPIAQVIFHVLDQPAENPYDGKYQDQIAGPQMALFD